LALENAGDRLSLDSRRSRQKLAGIANGRQRAAQLVGEHGEEFVFTAIRREQSVFGAAQRLELLARLVLTQSSAYRGLHGAHERPGRGGAVQHRHVRQRADCPRRQGRVRCRLAEHDYRQIRPRRLTHEHGKHAVESGRSQCRVGQHQCTGTLLQLLGYDEGATANAAAEPVALEQVARYLAVPAARRKDQNSLLVHGAT
jgi:hypothetical protein